MNSQRKRPAPRQGTAIVWPKALETRYDISAVTRWRYERMGKLPKRDAFIGGVAVGWKLATLEAAENGPSQSVA